MLIIWERLREFFNSDDEWHVWWIGWGDGALFDRKAKCPRKYIKEEHYYKFGKGMGALSWMFLPCLTAMVILL